MAANANGVSTMEATNSEAIHSKEGAIDMDNSGIPPPTKTARLSIGDVETIQLIINHQADNEINNIELEYKNITESRNGWHRLYQVFIDIQIYIKYYIKY